LTRPMRQYGQNHLKIWFFSSRLRLANLVLQSTITFGICTCVLVKVLASWINHHHSHQRNQANIDLTNLANFRNANICGSS